MAFWTDRRHELVICPDISVRIKEAVTAPRRQDEINCVRPSSSDTSQYVQGRRVINTHKDVTLDECRDGCVRLAVRKIQMEERMIVAPHLERSHDVI